MSAIAQLPLTALVVAGLAAVALSGCSVGVDLGGDATERLETEAVDAAGLDLVVLTTENGRVRVGGADVDEVVVAARLRETDEGDASFRIERDGPLLTVIGDCDAGWWQDCSVGFEVTVPADLDVEVETDNGRVDLEGLSGRIDVSTDNGAVDGQVLASRELHARTDNGRIELAFAEAPDEVTAVTDNGAVAIRYPDDGGSHDVDASSDNGSIDLDVRTDPAADRHVRVETDNGAIDIEYRS